MGTGLLKKVRKLFGRRKPSQAIAVQPVPPKRRFQQADYLRFIKKQLSFQSKYFPQLTEIHNSMLRETKFHKNGKAPVITGDRMADTLLARNMQQMCRLEYQINELRVMATKIRVPGRSLEDARKVWKAARKLERKFNDLKEQNSGIFLEFFTEKQKPAQ